MIYAARFKQSLINWPSEDKPTCQTSSCIGSELICTWAVVLHVLGLGLSCTGCTPPVEQLYGWILIVVGDYIDSWRFIDQRKQKSFISGFWTGQQIWLAVTKYGYCPSNKADKQLYHVETLQIIVVSALLSPSFPCDLNAALARRQFLSEQHGSIKHGSIHSSDQMFTRPDSDFWFQQLHWVIWTLTCRRLNEPTCGSVGVLSEFWSLTCPACSVKLSLIFTITFSFASSFGAMSMQATHCGCSDTQNRQLAASSLSRAGS